MIYPYFDAPLDIRYDREASVVLGKDHWRVLRSYRFMLSANQWLAVEAGTLTDGGSIPKLLHGVVSPWGQFGQAYVTHDQGCEYLSLTVGGKPYSISRERCDSLLYVAMQVLHGTDRDICEVRAGVDFYRHAAGVNLPSNTALKRSLEANWSDS